MRRFKTFDKGGRRTSWLAGLVLLGWAALSSAQTQTGGGTTGTGSTGGVGGAGGGLGGSSGGVAGGGGAAGQMGGNAFSGGQALQGGLGALGQSGGSSSGSLTGQLTPGSSGGSTAGSTSFMGPYYINPLSIGIATSSSNTGSSGGMSSGTPSFGVPLYNSTQTGAGGVTSLGRTQGTAATSTSRTGQRTAGSAGRATTGRSGLQTGMAGGVQGGMGGLSGLGGGLGAATGVRASAYTTNIMFPTQNLSRPQLRADLQEMIGRSSALASRERIQAVTDGEMVVLRGTVASEQEKRLAEAMARLTPGVVNLRNDLEVQAAAPTVPRP